MPTTMENEQERENSQEIYSKVVKAGKRTYFFDVKTTKGQDHYLTITESKKVFINGREVYQKHKIFLYKEDFEKFHEAISAVIHLANEKNGDLVENETNTSNLSFDDLD